MNSVLVQDGHLNIDNNRTERAIKPFVIGRKTGCLAPQAWGQKPVRYCTAVIETAKANGVEPVRYIQMLLDTLPKRKNSNDVEGLMPWMIKV